MSEKGGFIIDWLTAAVGDPKFDVAKTEMLMKYGSLPKEMPEDEKRKINEVKNKFLDIYLQEYTKLTALSPIELVKFKLPMYAARLIHNQDEQEIKILNMAIDEILDSLKEN